MIGKRTLFISGVILSGALIAAVLMPALRAPTRTLVAPVEVAVDRSDSIGGTRDPRDGGERQDQDEPFSNGDTSDGADPVPPASPVPYGDEYEDNSGPGSDNSGPGSDNSGPGSDDSGSDSDNSGSGSDSSGSGSDSSGSGNDSSGSGSDNSGSGSDGDGDDSGSGS